MPVTLSEDDAWKGRKIRTEKSTDTFFNGLLDSEGNVTSKYDHALKIFTIVWNLSREDKRGARQMKVIERMIEYCKNNREQDDHRGPASLPETWTNSGTVKTKTKQVLGRLVDAGLLVKTQDKKGERNPVQVFYQPHFSTYLHGTEIVPEYRNAAIVRLQIDNLALDRALAMTRNFLHKEGKWGEFLQWYVEQWGRPFPEFISDSLGIREAEPGEREQRLAGLGAWEEERLIKILGAKEGTVPTGDVRKRMEERLAWLQASMQGTP